MKINFPFYLFRYLYFLLFLLFLAIGSLRAQNIRSFAGNGVPGYGGDGGAAASSSLNAPNNMVSDLSGNIYIADQVNHRIRKVDANRYINSIAGNGTSGFSGDGGIAISAQLFYPAAVILDAAGNIYIADYSNHRIRKVDTDGNISTFAGTGTAGFSGDGGPATSAQLNSPMGLGIDGSGNIYIADFYDHRIRKVATDGTISTFAGNGAAGFSGDGGPATSAKLNHPSGIAIDAAGNMLIADKNNHRIRKVNTSGVMSTIAGTGIAGYGGDGGLATSAKLNLPAGIAIDAAGNILIADQYNNRIRKIAADGKMYTVAGNGNAGFSGDGSLATNAQLNSPSGVSLDALGNLFIADPANHRVRIVSSTISTGTIPANLCVNSNVAVSYSIQGTFVSGNIFTAQLSDATGSFASPVNIGSLTSTVSGTINAAIPINTAPGNGYRIRVVSSNAEAGSMDNGADLTVNPPPAVSISGLGASYCSSHPAISLTGNPAGGTFSGPGISGFTFTPANAGIGGPYLIIYSYTDGNGCIGTTSQQVSVVSCPCNVSGSVVVVPAVCHNGTGSAIITISGEGSDSHGTYTLDGGSPINFGSNPFMISSLSPGPHTVITTTGACTSSAINFTITAPAALTANFTANPRSGCTNDFDGSITLDVQGGSGEYNYAWSGIIGSGNPATTPYPDPGNVPEISGLQYGFYNVTITDANGCGSITFNNIHVKLAFPPVVVTDGSNSASCIATGKIVVYASAGVPPYTYQLDGGLPQVSNIFLHIAPGLHQVTAIDSRGCNTSKNVTVNAVPALGFTTYVYNASSCSSDGTIQVYRTVGVPPYTYSMDGSPFVGYALFTGLAAGLHNVTIKDGAGCTNTQSITVGQGAALSVTANVGKTSACIADGAIQVYVSGGVAPYSYSLNGDPSQLSAIFTGLATGTYTIDVSDARGCTGSTNATVNVNNINVTFYKINAANCEGTGTVQLYLSGGTGPYTYSLDGNNYQVSNVFSNVPPGTYTGYVKDYKTCIGQTVVDAINVLPEGCNNMRSAKAVRIDDAPGISVYPNPSVADFNLQWKGFEQGKMLRITVTDMMGRRVYQDEVSGVSSLRFGTTLKPGMYSVTLLQGERRVTQKLVKQ